MPTTRLAVSAMPVGRSEDNKDSVYSAATFLCLKVNLVTNKQVRKDGTWPWYGIGTGCGTS